MINDIKSVTSSLGNIISNKDIFLDIFDFFSKILSGFLIALTIFYIAVNPTSDLFEKITDFKANWNFYILTIIILYLLGYLSLIISDLIIFSLSVVAGKLMGEKNSSNFFKKLFRQMFEFVQFVHPLDASSDVLSEEYKRMVLIELTKRYKLNKATHDIVRLSREEGLNFKTIDVHKISHDFDILKSTYLAVIILFIYEFINSNYLLFILLFLLSIWIIYRLKQSSIDIRVRYLDSIILKDLKE